MNIEYFIKECFLHENKPIFETKTFLEVVIDRFPYTIMVIKTTKLL